MKRIEIYKELEAHQATFADTEEIIHWLSHFVSKSDADDGYWMNEAIENLGGLYNLIQETKEMLCK